MVVLPQKKRGAEQSEPLRKLIIMNEERIYMNIPAIGGIFASALLRSTDWRTRLA